TSRTEERRQRARRLGAAEVVETGQRLPRRVDAVIETVGAATWAHSVASVRPGGTVAVAGATTGDAPPAQLTRIFFNEITVRGVTMGSRDDLAALVSLCARTGLRPPIDEVLPLERVREGLERMSAGSVFGKIVVEP
ncbi:MAG: zinc-binding dehydrogenase, partial [Cellulomonadaceae bacterium]